MSFLSNTMTDGPSTSGVGGFSLETGGLRNTYGFGDRIAELSPLESPFFVYLSRVAKEPINTTKWQFLEKRHQWQRRNFFVSETFDLSSGWAIGAEKTGIKISCYYDKYGKSTIVDGVATETAPEFLLIGQVLAIKLTNTGSAGGTMIRNFLVSAVATTTGYATVSLKLVGPSNHAVPADSTTVITWEISDNSEGQVVGSAFAEATDVPTSWHDYLSANWGLTQIFKTSIELHSGSSMATEYRGNKNEWARQWMEKLKEHKMDIELAMLMGVGTDSAISGTRFSWGIIPYTELYGSQYSFSYANSGYDSVLDAMEHFFAPETGNTKQKLVLASRKVIGWMNKLGNAASTVGNGLPAGGFMPQTMSTQSGTTLNPAGAYRFNVQSIQGKFGHKLLGVSTIFGDLYFVEEPLLRGPYEDTAIAIDLANVKYRPLKGNGISRDTFIKTNVQGNGIDGRQDSITTEAGLEVSLPETHALFNFS